MWNLAANSEALLVGQAWLLDVNIDIAHGFGDSYCVMLHPAGIGIGDEPIAALKFPCDGMNAFDVPIRIAANLELKAAVALRPVPGNFRGHLLRRLLRDGAIEMHVFAIT